MECLYGGDINMNEESANDVEGKGCIFITNFMVAFTFACEVYYLMIFSFL
jgi:hypothetical protein